MNELRMAPLIENISRERIGAFCQKWKVRELSVFGSLARQDFHSNSDADLLVTFESDAPWSLFDFVTMRDELVEIVGRHVDLIEEDSLRNPFLRHEVLRDKRVIYAA